MDSSMSMSESMTLLTAQLAFLDTHVVLIHIPLEAYPLLLQPILRLILQNEQQDEDGNPDEPRRPWMYWHPFVNVSITPNECSIVCPREQADKLFRNSLDGLNPTLRKEVSISPEDYSVIAIGGEGLEAGQRVLDLTAPLAIAGIPIFFITSYYTDYILVPFSSRTRVITALETRGFIFEASANGNGEAGHMTNPASPTALLTHTRNGSSGSSFDFLPAAPSTPPPTSLAELQHKTFALLYRNAITPHVDRTITLVTCSASKTPPPPPYNDAPSPPPQTTLHHGLTLALTTTPPPKFLTLTLTDTDPASLTLETRLLRHFPEHDLLGQTGDVQVPVTLDLRALPAESTGIVCGVAGRLMEGAGAKGCEVGYLSTARAGHVVVLEGELDEVVEVLEGS